MEIAIGDHFFNGLENQQKNILYICLANKTLIRKANFTRNLRMFHHSLYSILRHSNGKMSRTVTRWLGLLDPVCEVPHEVEEEISLWYRDDFICDLDEQAEAFAGLQVQPLRDVVTEVLRPG